MKKNFFAVPIAAALMVCAALPSAAQSRTAATATPGFSITGSGDTAITVIRRGDGKPDDCTVRVADRIITGSAATAACERAMLALGSPGGYQRFIDSVFRGSFEDAELTGSARALQLRALEGIRNRNFSWPYSATIASTFNRSMIGVTTETRTRDTDQYGAYVTAVTPGSPAAQVGLRAGDVITKVNGVDIGTGQAPSRTTGTRTSTVAPRLSEVIAALEPGKPVRLEYRRGSTNYDRQITPTAAPGLEFTGRSMPVDFLSSIFPDSFENRDNRVRSAPREVITLSGTPVLALSSGSRLALRNAELAPMNEGLRSYFGTGTGVLVVNAPEDQSNNLDLISGDVILEIGGRAVTNPVQLFRILASYDRGEEVTLQIMRQKSSRKVNTRIP